MNGQIIADVTVYFASGGIAIGAKVGDKVEGQGMTITKLTRAGNVKLPVGDYRLPVSGCVAWDEVTPPPDPTPTDFPDYFILTNPEGVQVRYSKV